MFMRLEMKGFEILSILKDRIKLKVFLETSLYFELLFLTIRKD